MIFVKAPFNFIVVFYSVPTQVFDKTFKIIDALYQYIMEKRNADIIYLKNLYSSKNCVKC